ncbi:MAG: SulP family sulfate permease [Myxococcota bacterium]|jgi:SulP family sulfate permease
MTSKLSLDAIRADVLSGLTVALALVPEAVAFAFVADIPPVVGLYGALIMGLITSLFGGRPGMISGATGAMAVVMVFLVREGNAMDDTGTLGLQYLFATLLLVGVLQIAAGMFRLGKFVRMIPSPVMMGFVNGLAIVIFLSQLEMFKAADDTWLPMAELWPMLGLIAITMAIMYGLPKLTTKVPAALMAIIVVTAIVILASLDTPTVATFITDRGGSGIDADLPSFAVPGIGFTWDAFIFILPYALILAAIGLIESLMTLNLVDELTDTRGHANRECIAQGAANLANGFLGGMGGCAMIGQSIINIKSGGRGRLSGASAAIALGCFILFGATYIEMVPIAALIGVMFMVVISTFAWNTFKLMNKVPVADVLVMLLVTGLTVVFDLAIAVLAGVIVSALVFSWENAVRIRARKWTDDSGAKHYEIFGPLFFGSTTLFMSKFDWDQDPDEVIIDFAESRIMDQSAIETLNKLAARYQNAGKQLHLRHLSEDCRLLIERADTVCDVNVLEDPGYFVAVDHYREFVRKAIDSHGRDPDDGDLEDLAAAGRRLRHNSR